MQVTAESLKTLKLNEIAEVIDANWAKINFAAAPFVSAMYSLASISDNYYADTGLYVVSYFLSNAGTWKGDVAKLVKAELKARCAAYEKSRK